MRKAALALGLAGVAGAFLSLASAQVGTATKTAVRVAPDNGLAVPELDPQQGRWLTAIAVGGGSVVVASEDAGVQESVGGRPWRRVGPVRSEDPADDEPRSIAVDGRGRLWVGYGHHGVAVRDGRGNWKQYDAPAGPLGHRVWRIAVSPVDGDVWLATELGLARYSEAKDRWSYVLSAGSLPADQVCSIAFAADGTLYAGMSCEGLAIGSPKDDYAKWRVVTGPDRPGVEAGGAGLPSNLINDVRVMADGAVFVATDEGLAVSRDAGATFTFVRGAEFGDKAMDRVSADAPLAKPEAGDAPLVVEDHLNCLGETAGHQLLVGGWNAGWRRADPATLKAFDAENADGPAALRQTASDVVGFLPAAAGEAWAAATYGDGLVLAPGTGPVAVEVGPPADPTAPLPAEAGVRGRSPATVANLVAAAHGSPVTAAYLGEDWVTGGDATGRYGSLGADVNQLMKYGLMADGQPAGVTVGPNTRSGGPYYLFTNPSTTAGFRFLYLPSTGNRQHSEWNDGTFRNTTEATFEGADLWVSANVPADAGLYKLSLYFMNNDGHKAGPRRRDFTVEVQDGAKTMAEANFAPALARCRVRDFYDPVVESFLVRGGKPYLVKVGRNFSSVAKLCGIFLDRVTDVNGSVAAPTMTADAPVDPTHWGPPAVPEVLAGDPPAVRSARAVWDELDRHWDDDGVVTLQRPLRLLAYRQAAAAGADPKLLENWRWHLGLWTEADRLTFCKQMDASFDWAVENAKQKPDATKRKTAMVAKYERDHAAAQP